MKWFDRRFSFDEPPWMYPNLLERLRGTPARVEDLVSDLDSDVLLRREGDRWSIQENVGHLLDLEELWIGRVGDIIDGANTMRPADLSNRKTHEANHNDQPLSVLLAAFRGQRAALVRRLESARSDQIEASSLHPRLKQPMRLIDLAYFVAEHDDHHLVEINRLRFDRSGRRQGRPD